jgi:hypothetical protein
MKLNSKFLQNLCKNQIGRHAKPHHEPLELTLYRADERLHPDLWRGRGTLIGEDLNVDDEGSKQNFEHLQSLHHCSAGYQSMRHELTSPRRLILASAIENTSKNEVDAI